MKPILRLSDSQLRRVLTSQRLFGNRWLPQTTAARGPTLLTSACRLAIAYNRVGTGRTPSAVSSSSNFPTSHLGSEFGLIAQSYRAFSSPPLGLTYMSARPGALPPPSPPAEKATGHQDQAGTQPTRLRCLKQKRADRGRPARL
jgi:hypothetical protein